MCLYKVLPFFVVLDETESAVITNASQECKEYKQTEPCGQVDNQILWYAFVVFNYNTRVVV